MKAHEPIFYVATNHDLAYWRPFRDDRGSGPFHALWKRFYYGIEKPLAEY